MRSGVSAADERDEEDDVVGNSEVDFEAEGSICSGSIPSAVPETTAMEDLIPELKSLGKKQMKFWSKR